MIGTRNLRGSSVRSPFFNFFRSYLLGNAKTMKWFSKKLNKKTITATRKGDIAAVRLLLNRNDVNVDHQDNDGWTALLWASKENSIDVARLLIDRGANIEHQDNSGWTALILASRENSIDVARLLIDRGAYVDHPNNFEETALFFASEKNSIDFAQLLIDRGADIEHQDFIKRTPLILASTNNSIDVARLLIDRGANIDHQKKNGDTALLIATEKNSIDVARLLIDRGANIDHQDLYGYTALLNASLNNSIDVARLLMDRGANIEHQNKNGTTALIYASTNNSIDVARLLIDRGANIDHQNNQGKTALSIAKAKGYWIFVSLLKEHSIKTKAAATVQTSSDSSMLLASALSSETSIQSIEPISPIVLKNDEIDKSRKKLVQVMRGEKLEPIELCQVYVEQCTKNFAHRLGSGAFGEVYFGNDEQENIYFAVKKVPFEVTLDEIENIILTLQQEMSVRIRLI
jgi:ankyrin repeat protein